jgi:head-tail adaptor
MLKGRTIGKMDILLTIEQPTFTRNAINEDEVSWSQFGQYFAERVWGAGGEKFEGKQETNIDSVTFNLRYVEGITPLMRLKQANETTYFQINNVRSSMREGLTILNAIRRDNQ